MIVDTSAIIAILRNESEARLFAHLIGAAEFTSLSAGSWIELSAVTSKEGNETIAAALPILMHELRIEIAPVTVGQARIGYEAYQTFGKGKHEARLNFGDCFAYALAKETGLPLLFKGNDFSQTDVMAAI